MLRVGVIGGSEDRLASLEPASSSQASTSGPSAECGGEFGTKISALVECLGAICRQGEKAIVFAQWQDLIFRIHAALTKSGVPAAVLAGGPFDRASVLQRFESPELPVLLLSLEDSASGTNMAHANHVLLVHPMMAASSEEQRAYEAQAVGRVCRWGQRRQVHVWRFVMEGTVEADIAARHFAGEEDAAVGLRAADGLPAAVGAPDGGTAEEGTPSSAR